MKDSHIPGIKPDIKAPNPKDHPFDPYEPWSTKCKWCAFAITAHCQIADGAQLHEKHSAQIAESG